MTTNTKKPLKIALIGTEFMGKAHSNAWHNINTHLPTIPTKKQIIVGNNPTKTKTAAQTYQWEEHSTNWEEIITRQDIDIIDICTPNNLHAPIALAALKAGKHVIIEKPLANTLQETQTLIETSQTAQQKNIFSMVSFNYRTIPALTLAKQLISENKLGKILHLKICYLQDWLNKPETPLNWRLQKEIAGSGALADLGSHAIDQIFYLLNDPILETTATLKTFTKQRPNKNTLQPVTVDDAMWATLFLKSGTIASLETSRVATGKKNNFEIQIFGTKGNLHFNLENLNELNFHNNTTPENIQGSTRILVTEKIHPYLENWWPPGHILGWEHSFIHEIKNFLQNINNHTPPTPTILDAAKVQHVLHAITTSANNNSTKTKITQLNTEKK